MQYEGFSTEDATIAVDSIDVDWNVQAAKTAKEYLDMSGYSHSGLVGQLEVRGLHPNASGVWSSRSRALGSRRKLAPHTEHGM